MNILALSYSQLASHQFCPGAAVIILADSEDMVPAIRAGIPAIRLLFHDVETAFATDRLRPPSLKQARMILEFVREHPDAPELVIACQRGIGRSQAVKAALLRIEGRPYAEVRAVKRTGTYNRTLYRLLLEAAGLPPDPEPLVSIAVSAIHGPSYLHSFYLSMRHQRWQNWEMVTYIDGTSEDDRILVKAWELKEIDNRFRLITTPKLIGSWGHGHRQAALDACRGDFIGTNSDDNYLTPGYLEQLALALESADLSICDVVHSYQGWEPMQCEARVGRVDMGCFLARRELVRRVPWPGLDRESDGRFIEQLAALAGPERVAFVRRCLFVHN